MVYPAPTRPPSLPTRGRPGVPDISLSSVAHYKDTAHRRRYARGPSFSQGEEGTDSGQRTGPGETRLEASAVLSVRWPRVAQVEHCQPGLTGPCLVYTGRPRPGIIDCLTVKWLSSICSPS